MKFRRFPLNQDTEMVPVSEEHAEAIVRWRNNKDNRPSFISDYVFTIDSQLAWIKKQRLDATDLTYVAVRNHEPIAMAALTSLDQAPSYGEYGRLIIDNKCRRHGLGLAITNWFLALGFQTLGLQMIFSNCLADNPPIHTLLSILGYHPVSTWRHEESQREVIRFECTPATWNRTAFDPGR